MSECLAGTQSFYAQTLLRVQCLQTYSARDVCSCNNEFIYALEIVFELLCDHVTSAIHTQYWIKQQAVSCSSLTCEPQHSMCLLLNNVFCKTISHYTNAYSTPLLAPSSTARRGWAHHDDVLYYLCNIYYIYHWSTFPFHRSRIATGLFPASRSITVFVDKSWSGLGRG